MLTGKSILVTGGTGSSGKEFTRTVLTRYPDIRRLVTYSRDELKQFDRSRRFPESEYHPMRYFIGDVRDKERLYRALEGIDIVVHAAANWKVLFRKDANANSCRYGTLGQRINTGLHPTDRSGSVRLSLG